VTPTRLLVALALALCVARPSHAQADRSGRIEGTVTDSVHARPLAGVRVVAVGVQAPDVMRGDATSTPTGTFRIDSLPPGRYMVGFESPLLDSLEIALPPRDLTVAPGGAATIALALPPATKLRAAVCAKATLPAETGAVYGHVVSAETENPLAGIEVAMAWRELSVDRQTLRPTSSDRAASVTTDAGGWYVVCGVPTGTWLSMQLRHAGRAGPVFRAIVDDTLGIAIRHLSFAPSASRSMADSAADGDSVDTGALTGPAMLSGTVLDPADRPVAAAEVRVGGTSGVTHTDSAGRYSLADLPVGTQLLEVRRLGFAVAERTVELRSATPATIDVRLHRIVNLDSVRIVATRQRYREYDAHRKRAFGLYLGPEQMVNQGASFTSDIVRKIPGFRVLGTGIDATVVGNRGGSLYACPTNVVIDGSEDRSINEVRPFDIGAMEFYRQGVPTPDIYDRGCGAVVIWTKR
jgi:Carboxypeptidase regulatory-like domain